MKRTTFVAGLLICGAAHVVQADDISPQELFSRLDKNGDGQLVADEIPEGQFRFFERAVRLGDENGDGKITVEELTAVLRQKSTADSSSDRDPPGRSRGPRDGERRNPEDLFNMLDRDGDGKITKEELPERAQERLAPLFERLGTDSISLEQFREAGQMFGRPGGGDRPQGRGPRPDEGMPRGRDGREGGMGRPPFPPPTPKFVKLLDTDGNGTLNQNELANFNQKFAELDTNGDGELDHAELMGHPDHGPGSDRPEMRGERGPEGRGPRGPGRGDFGPQELFQRMDADGDGVVTKDEAPARIQAIFGQLDADGDGKLDPAELRNGLEKLRNRPREPRE